MKTELIRLIQLFVEHGLWPTVAFFAVVRFRPEISQALGRINKLGPVDLEPSHTQPKEPLESEKARLAAEEVMKSISDNIVLQELQENINKDLQQRQLAGRVEAIPPLVKTLAAVLLAMEFESIYNSIFGSQLAILNHLNSLAPQGDSTENIKQFYKNAVAAFPAAYVNKSFDEYIAFLLARLVVRKDNDRYFLTNKGKEFLMYIVKVGHPLNRLF